MQLLKVLVVIIFSVILLACAPKQESRKRYFWPPFTDEPKIEYLGFIQSDYDVLKRKYGRLEKVVFGREVPAPLFSNPYDIYSDGSGKIFVSEPVAGHVKILDTLEPKISYLKSEKGEINEFKQPMGLAGDSRGNLYVADSVDRKILYFGPDGFLISKWVGDYLKRPISLVVDEQRNRVYVVDADQHKVLVLSKADGSLLSTIGERGGAGNQFNFPVDIDIDETGALYVLDSMNAKVKVFSPEGEFRYAFGERGTALGSFQVPKGIAVSPAGLVYVSDSMAHRFVVFDRAGNFLQTIGGRFEVDKGRVSPGGLNLPQGIDADASEGLWVVDSLNRMIHHFQYLTSEYLLDNPILPGEAALDFGEASPGKQ